MLPSRSSLSRKTLWAGVSFLDILANGATSRPNSTSIRHPSASVVTTSTTFNRLGVPWAPQALSAIPSISDELWILAVTECNESAPYWGDLVLLIPLLSRDGQYNRTQAARFCPTFTIHSSPPCFLVTLLTRSVDSSSENG